MTDYLTLSKQSPAFPEYLDFQVLRAISIEHVQKLSRQIWTDYNLHDPGITILEVLCYALTDLGYRKNLDLKDLLTRDRNDISKKDNNFFTPDQILTCNPVTELDWRKRLIDIPGVRNVWLEKVIDYQPEIYVNCPKSQLQYDLPPNQTKDQALRLNPRGLYDICLDLESEYLQQGFDENPLLETVISDVKAVLCSYRNLCEDFQKIVLLGQEEIGLCADIELEPNADPENILVEIYIRVQNFLAPRLQFYTLQELLNKGKDPAEIFAGRPSVFDDNTFSYSSHGFIDSDELKDLEFPEAIYVSDIYQIVMDVPGVAAIKKLSVINYIDGQPQSQGHPWYLKLTNKHRPVLGIEQSTVTFFKGDLPFKADPDEVKRRYHEQQAAYIKVPRERHELDLPVPQGSYYDLADHYSIHHDFPLTYGISKDGLPTTASAQRKAQAKQLKGYLIFFDQLFANYLAQLAHIRDLFSWESETERQQRRTYFTQILTNVPGIEEIILNYNGVGVDDYESVLAAISEDEITYKERRNRFLDHLLARFAETFTDYVVLNYQLRGGRRDEVQIIDDKAQFLQEYPALSRDRFRASNYCNCNLEQEPIWDTENVSGFQRRVSRLLGIENVNRRSLSFYDIAHTSGDFTLAIRCGTDQQLTMQISDINWEEAQSALEELIAAALQPSYYRLLTYRYFYHYSWEITNLENKAIATYDLFFPTQAERFAILEELIATLQTRLTSDEDSETLDNFINLEEDDPGQFRFNLRIPLETEEILSFTGTQHYATAEEARQIAQNTLSWIRLESRYRPMRVQQQDAVDRQVEAAEVFTYYSYGLVNDSGNLLATTANRFLTTQERDIALQRCLSKLIANQNNFSVIKLTPEESGDGYAFFLELPQIGDVAPSRLRSLNSYSTEADAWRAARLFAENLRYLDRYVNGVIDSEDTVDDFGITDEAGSLIVATNIVYDPLDVFQQLNNLDDTLLQLEPVAGESPGYRFLLVDRNDRLLLRGTQIEPDEETTRRQFYRDVLGQLFIPEAVERLDTPDGYGFRIITAPSDSEDEPNILAIHPQPEQPEQLRYYETVEAREAAIAKLFQAVRTSRLTREIQLHIPAFTGYLYDTDGQILMRGTQRYTYELAYLGSSGEAGEINQTWQPDGDVWQSLMAGLIEAIATDELQTQVTFAGETTGNNPLYRFQLTRNETPWLIGSQQFLTQNEAMQSGNKAIQQLRAEYRQWGETLIDESAIRSEESERSLWRLQRDRNGREFSLVLFDLDRMSQAKKAAWQQGNILIELAQNSNNFRQIEDETDGRTIAWELTNKGKDRVLGIPNQPQSDNTTEQESVIQQIQNRINDEGFHLVEHILLRPRRTASLLVQPPEDLSALADLPPPEQELLPITLSKIDCDSLEDLCRTNYDPYSFWISIVLPYWPERFRDMNFRRFVERTLRLEAPVHIALKICWIDVHQMRDFEVAYRNWLEQLTLEACQQETDNVTDSLNRFIQILPQLTNVYPEGTLHDCEESGPEDNPIILNQTALGTANQ